MCVGIKYIYSCECYWFCSVVIERVYRVLIRVLEIYEKFNLIEGEFVIQCYSKIVCCMVKNGNFFRVFELSVKVFVIREQRRFDELLKYVVCCNDRVGSVGLIVLLIEIYCFLL